MRMKWTWILLLMMVFPSLHAQIVIFKGHVFNSRTRQAVPGVNIYLKDTNIGTVSDQEGAFHFQVADPSADQIIVFSHVSFKPLELTFRIAQQSRIFILIPKVIELPVITVRAKREPQELFKEIPQTYAIIESEAFDNRGYRDVGDLLKSEQGVQINETVSGSKTIAVRGGNFDDVIILYDGIKINSIANSMFNLSQINLENVKEIEIIRGSNSVLYGAGATSGVINIVPKLYRDYTIKVQQRFGTHTASDANLQLHRDIFNRLNVAYTFRLGNSHRVFKDNEGTQTLSLKNLHAYHTASMEYRLSKQPGDDPDYLRLMYFQSDLGFENVYFEEDIKDRNQIVFLRFIGDLWKLRRFNITASYQWLDNRQSQILENRRYTLDFLNRMVMLDIEKAIKTDPIELLLAYQYESGNLNFNNGYIWTYLYTGGLREAEMIRHKHGFVSIVKLHIPAGSNYFKTTDLNASYRYEHAQNAYLNSDAVAPVQSDDEYEIDLSDRTWRKSMVNVSGSIFGQNERTRLNAHINMGTNFKFPLMVQQIGSPMNIDTFFKIYQPNLHPEWSSSLELAGNFYLDEIATPVIHSGQLGISLFRTTYTNKIRLYTSPFSPVTVYDNVASAKISGIETHFKIYFTPNAYIEYEDSIYQISDKTAFPYKSDRKHIFNFSLELSGYSFILKWFFESEKVAWTRTQNDQFNRQELPDFSNMDIHIRKTFDMNKFKIFASLSGFNILGDATEIEGFAIRDTRLYLTIGLQY